jgi:multidrug resistance efflux pump
MAEAALARAEAQLALLKAGAWQPEIAVAKAAVAKAEADAQRVETQIKLLRVAAPIKGQVLQVNVRRGEFVATPAAEPLLVMGQTATLHVRVDVDEQDISRYRTGAPGVAKLRGGSEKSFPLTFVRVEPFVVPKKSLTGENTERIDTRVLQVIYEIDPRGEELYVGQQVDVFLDVGDEALSGKH